MPDGKSRTDGERLMVNQELLSVLDQLHREKGIPQETLLEALQSAILTAARRRYGGGDNFQVEIDPRTGEIQVLHIRRIVENVTSPMEEVSLAEAMESDTGAEVGDEIGAFLEIDDFGRISAQAAKQVIFQKVREAEWSVVAREFGGKKGNVVAGVYIGQEKRNFIIDLGKTEAILPFKEQIPRESFHRGDRVKALLLDIRTTTRGPQLILSRTHPDFLARLFEKEVPEISEGIIEIKGVVRDPGERAKVAVLSRDPNVDPVGSCVGVKGSRVQAIVREIHGEKIDIIDWSPDPGTFIARALSPAKVLRVATRDGEFEKVATVVVANQQLSLATTDHSASRTFWKITCFAAWAAMRPKSSISRKARKPRSPMATVATRRSTRSSTGWKAASTAASRAISNTAHGPGTGV